MLTTYRTQMVGTGFPKVPFVFQLLLFLHIQSQMNEIIIAAVSGQEISPISPSTETRRAIGNNNGPILRSFLDPCEILTLETQCSDEEYESNEDCLPQKTDNCDHSKELFCLSGVCLPNCHPHKESYDPFQGKCFRKVGSDCRSVMNSSTISTMTREASSSEQTTTSSSHSSSKSNQDEPLSTVIVPPCETNAVCERGLCRCAKEFTYDHSLNKCLLFAPFSGYCNETVNCDRKSDIECHENECQCKSPETQYFHLKRKRCYILIDQVCSSGLQFCPDNSNCVRTREGDGATTPTSAPLSKENFTIGRNSSGDYRLRQLYQELSLNRREIVDGDEEHFIGILGEDEERKFVCECDRGYGSTRDKRFCLGLHNARCNTLHRCNFERGLKCYDGTCICDRERRGEQVYSEQFQTCITAIGAPCLADGKGEREEDICPVGASCRDGRCACEDDLIPSILTTQTTTSIAFSCMKSHRMPCSPGNDSLDIFEPICNLEIGLECNAKDEKCLCKNSELVYDRAERRCRGFRETREQTHFASPSDREYTFRKNGGSNSSQFLIIITITASSIIICGINIFFG